MIFPAPPAATLPSNPPPRGPWKVKALSIGIYLGAAGALGRCLGFRHFMVVWTDRYITTAILSVIVLVFASFLALTERKYAYAIGFIGTLLAWPLMLVFEVDC